MTDRAEYARRTPRVGWVEDGETSAKPVTAYYRLANREMLNLSGERTLNACLIPRSTAHINTVFGTAFSSRRELVRFLGLTHALLIDFQVKSSGAGHANFSLMSRLPLLTSDSPSGPVE